MFLSKTAFPDCASESLPAVHRNAVMDIADDMKLSEDRVFKLYSIVLEGLSREARIVDYLPILVTRRVKILLNKIAIDNGRSDTTQQ